MKLRLILFLFFLSFFAGLVWAQESPEEWFKKGIKAAEAQDYEKAISCFKKTIALHPNHVASYSNIGYVYVVKEMWDEAIDVYKKALAISPNDARIHHDLGFSLYKKGMLDEAIEEFKKGIALDSEFAPAYENIGVLYAEKRMFDEAILTFKKALDISPDDPTTHFNLGRAYKALGNDILAADHYCQAGILHLKKDNRDEALKAYKDLLSCSKEIASVLFKKLYPEEKASDLITSLPSKKKDQWYVLLTRMNVRKGHYISSKILGQLDKGTEFQVIREAPNNTPFCSWYLIRTKSGFSGWLCGIYNGVPKYKSAPEPKGPSLPSSPPRYVLLTRMNVRKDPYIPSKLLGQLDKGAEFQIIKEAPNNTPLCSWYLIRTESGFSGWLCGIYKGSAKYKPAATSNAPSP